MSILFFQPIAAAQRGIFTLFLPSLLRLSAPLSARSLLQNAFQPRPSTLSTKKSIIQGLNDVQDTASHCCDSRLHSAPPFSDISIHEHISVISVTARAHAGKSRSRFSSSYMTLLRVRAKAAPGAFCALRADNGLDGRAAPQK